MGSDSITTTTGYWYYMSAHLILGHRVDEVQVVRFGDKKAWSGSVKTSQQIEINRPGLFGGQDREGGVVGKFHVVMGADNEPVNGYLQFLYNKYGVGVPAFRGVTSFIIKNAKVAANNPYLRPVSFRAARLPSKGWYDAKGWSGSAGSANPAHIIRECLTNATWGLGSPESELDDTSFRAAADQLFNEGFGLSFVWDDNSTIHDFIGMVIDHIQAVLYVNPFTGLFVLKLIRDDYDHNTMLTLNETNIVLLDSYERTAPSDLVSQVTVIWYDVNTDRKRSTTVHNLAVRELQGGPVAATLEFAGITYASLAQQVATRELKRLSSPVAKVVLRAAREASNLMIGDVFKLNWPDLGIAEMNLRVARIEHGNLGNGVIRLHCIEDVFSFGESLYAPPPDTLWEDPINDPLPTPYHRATEAPFILVSRRTNESQSALNEIDPMSGFLTYQASAPTADAFSYKLYTRLGGAAYAYRSGAHFCPTATLVNPLPPAVTSTIEIADVEVLSLVTLDTYAYINDECVAVIDVTPTAITVNRGILDTYPANHAAGSRVWFAQGHEAVDQTLWMGGVTVNAKALTVTGRGTLDEAAAPVDSLTIVRRWYLPYPPGNLTVNGLRWPGEAITGDVTLAWSHRNRLTQLAYYVKQDEGSFIPEAGTTYTLTFYNEAGTLYRSIPGYTGDNYVYTQAMIATDAPGAFFTFTIGASRLGTASWQNASVRVRLV